MTVKSLFAIVLGLVVSYSCIAEVQRGSSGWTIVDSFIVPEGASGLAFDGTDLYCGIYGVDGGRIYRINPNSGAVTPVFVGYQEDAFGLTYDGEHLWTTDHQGSSSTPAFAMKLDWNGDVIEPEQGLIAIGSGGPFAQASARALLENTELSAHEIVEKGLDIAADICIYTNHNRTLEVLSTND